MQPRFARVLYELLQSGRIHGLNGLMESDALGKVSLDRLYDFLNSIGAENLKSPMQNVPPKNQLSLF